MSQFESQHPEEFWRKAFDDAAETPPLRVWEAIERQLDNDQPDPVVPLWRRPWPGAPATTFRWAGGVAAALVLLWLGWWAWPDRPAGEPVATTTGQPATQPATTSDTPAPLRPDPSAQLAQSAGRVGASSVRAGQRGLSPAPAQPSVARPSAARPDVARPDVARPSATTLPTPPADQLAATTLPGNDPLSEGPGPVKNRTAVPEAHSSTGSGLAGRDARRSDARPDDERVATTDVVSPSNATTLTALPVVAPLAARPFRSAGVGTQRIVWYRTPDEDANVVETAPTVRKDSREAWASVSVMPSSFNPSVALRTIPAAAAFTTAQNTILADGLNDATVPSVSSQPNFSVAYQAGAGLHLSEHWTLETGVAYLEGRSNVVAPMQQPARVMTSSLGYGGAQNVFAEVIRNNVQRNAADYVYPNSNLPSESLRYVTNSNLYDSQGLASVANNFRYVQVPLQAGYQFRPRKRLSFSVLGGLLANWFVRNTVADALVVRPADGLYRPLTLAGTAGLRLRYRPSRRWSTSLAGVYQQNLQYGTQPGSEVITRPHTVGMNVGLNYHFR